MKKIDYVMPFAEGFLVRGINDAGGKAEIPIWEARCGISPPTDTSLGYYCLMVGLKQEINESGKDLFLFLTECQEQSQSAFFEKLADDLHKMRCTTIYTNRDGNDGFYRHLWDQVSNFGSTNVSLRPAPFANDVAYGKSLILDWLKSNALDIPKYTDTILKKSLEQVTTDSSNEPPAFHALRYVLGGFVRDPNPRMFKESVPSQRMDLSAWT